jgi:hypothetical protein
MSMRVMKVKHNARIKNQQVNSRGLFSLATTRGNQGGCNSVPVYQVDYSGGVIIQQSGPTNMCANYNYVPRAPSRQQSYSLYLKRATMGVGGAGGLASRVVDFPPNSGGPKGTFQKMLTYKRPQSGGVDGFTSSSYVENVRSKALRCDYSQVDKEEECQTPVGNGTSGGMMGQSQNPQAASHPCSNGCGKIPCITQNLGYLSASQQINKKLSQRGANPGNKSTALTTNYESAMMNSSSDGTCG